MKTNVISVSYAGGESGPTSSTIRTCNEMGKVRTAAERDSHITLIQNITIVACAERTHLRPRVRRLGRLCPSWTIVPQAGRDR